MYGEPMYDLFNTEMIPMWKIMALYALVPILMGFGCFFLSRLIRRSFNECE